MTANSFVNSIITIKFEEDSAYVKYRAGSLINELKCSVEQAQGLLLEWRKLNSNVRV